MQENWENHRIMKVISRFNLFIPFENEAKTKSMNLIISRTRDCHLYEFKIFKKEPFYFVSPFQ